MKRYLAIFGFVFTAASATGMFAGDYLIVGTQANGGGAIYQADGGNLTLIDNLPAVAAVPWGARAAYYHEADDTLYFAEGDSPAEWSVPLGDLLNPGIRARARRIRGFDNRGGGEAHPDIFFRGPQDGEIYSHTRGGGRLWRYNPVTDSVTDMGVHTAATDSKIYQVVYGNTVYTHNGGNGFRAWDQVDNGDWSAPYDPGISDVLNSHATAVRVSDGTYFSGRSGTIAYGSFDIGGSSPGTLPRLDPISPLNSMDVSGDGTKLWVAGFQPHISRETNYLGYFDISGDLANARFTLVVSPGSNLPGLSGHDWRISIVSIVEPGPHFRRGDSNNDGEIDLSDSMYTLSWLFLGGPAPGCLAAIDTNGDGTIDITDPTFLLSHLFLGGPEPVAPFTGCGTSELETDEELGCGESPCS